MKITPKDKLILFELLQNARQSSSQISKKVDLTKETTNNRINSMVKNKVIKRFSTIINYPYFGKTRHSVFFDLEKHEKGKINQAIKKIVKIPEIGGCYVIHDLNQWKLYTSLWTKDILDFDRIITKIMTILGDLVQNYISFQSVQSYTFLPRFLNPHKKGKCDVKKEIKNIKLKPREEKLLALLKENSRQKNSTLAKKLGVSEDTISRDIKKLIGMNIIQRFYPLIDRQKVGLKEHIFLTRVNPAATDKIKEFIKWARSNPHFTIIISAVGWINLYYDFLVENEEQFREIRQEILSRIKDITLKEFRIEVEEFIV